MKKPLYMDIADKIIVYIKENKLQPGAKLPTYREFADVFGVSTRTVGNAIERLSYKRMVDISPQYGIFVAHEAWESLYPNKFNWNSYLNRSKDLPINVMKPFAKLRASSEYPIFSFSSITLSPEFGWYKLLSESSQKALENLSPESIYAPSTDDVSRYKATLAKHMKGYGLDVSHDSIILAKDMHSSLRHIIHTFFKLGSICYYISPSVMDISTPYYDIAGYFRMPIPTDSEGIDIEYFLRNIKKGISSFIVVMPELSLSGITMSMRRRKELYAICAANGIPIIELDGFRDFRKESLPPIKALDTCNLVFYVNSFNNTVDSSQCGWIAAAPELAERLSFMLIAMRAGADMFMHRTAYEMLVDGSYIRYVQELRNLIHQREKMLHKLLEKYIGDIASWDENSNVFFWIKFRNNIDTFKIVNNNEGIAISNFKQFPFAETNSVFVCILGMKQDEMEMAVEELSYLARKSIA